MRFENGEESKLGQHIMAPAQSDLQFVGRAEGQAMAHGHLGLQKQARDLGFNHCRSTL